MRDHSWSILPAAKVLFNKTKVALSELPLQWTDGTVVVCRKPNGQLHFIAGSQGSYSKIGERRRCVHDQTGAEFGTWEVINEVSWVHLPDGRVEWTAVEPSSPSSALTLKAAMAVFK